MRRPDSTLTFRLERAFGDGDAAALMAEAAARLDVAVLGEGARYSRTQAAFVLQAFFREHPPLRATFGTAGVADGARSLLGTYQSTDGASLRLDVRLRRRAARWEIVGIQIERPRQTGTDGN